MLVKRQTLEHVMHLHLVLELACLKNLHQVPYRLVLGLRTNIVAEVGAMTAAEASVELISSIPHPSNSEVMVKYMPKSTLPTLAHLKGRVRYQPN
jgi:hypothetical protein